MKKMIVAASLAAAMAAPAMAEGFDMAELSCAELLAMDDNGKGVVLFWIDGYVSHKTSNTMVNIDGIKADGAKIGEYCAANADAKVLAYVEAATTPQ